MPIAPPIRMKLEKLPKSSATWQVAQVQVDPELVDGALQTWLVCTQGDGVVRAESKAAGLATEARWCKLLVDAMQTAPPGGRPMVPKLLRTCDAGLADVLQPIVAPLKVRVEAAAGPVLADEIAAAWAAPQVADPSTLANERVLWRLLADVHALDVDGMDAEDREFALTTTVPGWEAPVVVWMAAQSRESGAGIYVFPSQHDMDRYDADEDGTATDFRAVCMEFVATDVVMPTALSRAGVRKLDLAHCHCPLFQVHDLGSDEPREFLNASETAVASVVVQALMAWAHEHLLAQRFADDGRYLGELPIDTVTTLPEIGATIVAINVTDKAEVPGITWSWPVELRCDLTNGAAQLALVLPGDAVMRVVTELEHFDALQLSPYVDGSDQVELFGVAGHDEPLQLTLLDHAPLASPAWRTAASKAAWVIEVLVVAVQPERTGVVHERVMPVKWGV